MTKRPGWGPGLHQKTRFQCNEAGEIVRKCASRCGVEEETAPVTLRHTPIRTRVGV